MIHIITALTAQKRNTQRINVYLDGEFAFGLTRFVAAWLYLGQELSDEKITELQTEDAREVAYQKALNLLDYRPRTAQEIRQKLQKHEISADNIDYVLERLARSGLLNDQQFAQSWVDNRSEMRPRGRRALAYELRQRGVDQQTIEKTLENVDEEPLAYQAAVKRLPRLRGLEWQDFRTKLYRYLAQRGFNYEVCAPVIARLWQEQNDNQSPSDEEVNNEW